MNFIWIRTAFFLPTAEICTILSAVCLRYLVAGFSPLKGEHLPESGDHVPPNIPNMVALGGLFLMRNKTTFNVFLHEHDVTFIILTDFGPKNQ